MTREGHPVSPLLFVGKPQHMGTVSVGDPQLAADFIREEVPVSVPDAETAKEVLGILGSDPEHAHNQVHYAD